MPTGAPRPQNENWSKHASGSAQSIRLRSASKLQNSTISVHRNRSLRNGKILGRKQVKYLSNSLLISASQKVGLRLSFERAHADQTDKDRSGGHTRQSTTPHCKEGRASTFNTTRRRSRNVETDACDLIFSVPHHPLGRFSRRAGT